MCVFQNNLRFPDDIDDVSDSAKDLIQRLITLPEKRLGQEGIADFQQHDFFTDINWDGLKESTANFLQSQL